MTTSVTIRHDGPATHDVIVDVVRADTFDVLQKHVLTDGKSMTFYVYRGQSLVITEGLSNG